MHEKTPVRLVIWDWNGTLVDDAHASHQSVNDMLERMGLPLITFEQYSSYIETPIIGFYRHIIDIDNMDFAEISKDFHENSARHMAGKGLMRGGREVLELLKNAGIRQVIVSSCENGMLADQTKKYGVTDYFDALLGADDFHAGSKVGRAQEYMKQCAVPPEQTVVVGDLLHDAEMAQAIGARCLLVAKGHQLREHLEPEINTVLDDISEVPEHVL